MIGYEERALDSPRELHDLPAIAGKDRVLHLAIRIELNLHVAVALGIFGAFELPGTD